MDQIKSICFYCKTEQNMIYKSMSDHKLHYVCPGCNATNSTARLMKENKEKENGRNDQ
jgi:hypothetical protein